MSVIDFILMLGCLTTAFAVSVVCGIGMVVWLAGCDSFRQELPRRLAVRISPAAPFPPAQPPVPRRKQAA